jgi:membrane-bound lytic murein transglycosylase B
VTTVPLRRRAATLLTGVLVVWLLLPSGPAGAETAADAQAAARAAAERVEALQPRIQRAAQAYDRALRRLASDVGASVAADAEADRAAAAAYQQQRRLGGRVRALYMTGGSAALYATVLDAASVSDAFRRVVYVQRLVREGGADAARAAEVATALQGRAGRLEGRSDRGVVTASDVTRAYADLAALLAQAQDELARLDARASELVEAERAAARLRALARSVERSAADRVATARAAKVPGGYLPIYRAAATTCPGLPWTVLAAIGQVESGHGTNTATSYAGAQGPMQFLPSTFAAYAVDGDKDGDKDILDPYDAIYSAARYLCANGAGRGPDALARAIWRYNNADWYVRLVLKLSGQIAAEQGEGEGE